MDAITLNGRWAPNGAVVEMSERPPALTPQQWFDHLSRNAGDACRTLAGGRFAFTLARERLDALKAAAAQA